MAEHPKLNKFWKMSIPDFDLEYASWKLLGCPVKNRRLYLEDIRPYRDEQIVLMNTFNQILRNHRGAMVFVSGGKDTGKTFLGSALVNSCGRWANTFEGDTCKSYDYNPRFVSLPDLIDRITNFRSFKDWYNEYCNEAKLLVIDRWNLLEGKESVAPGVKKKLEAMLKQRNDNGYITVILSRLLWVDAKEQFTPAFKEELPEIYVRALAYPYQDFSNPFSHDDDEVDIDL